MEIWCRSPFHSNTVIVAKFCTWHDSTAVIACAKFVAIWWPTTELQQGQASIEFMNCRQKIFSEMGPSLSSLFRIHATKEKFCTSKYSCLALDPCLFRIHTIKSPHPSLLCSSPWGWCGCWHASCQLMPSLLNLSPHYPLHSARLFHSLLAQPSQQAFPSYSHHTRTV